MKNQAKLRTQRRWRKKNGMNDAEVMRWSVFSQVEQDFLWTREGERECEETEKESNRNENGEELKNSTMYELLVHDRKRR